MTRSKRLQPVVRVAESREQDAARRLGESQAELHRCQEQLAQLQAYRTDYAHSFHQAGAGGVDGARLQDFHTFLTNLDEAIAQQQARVQQAARVCEERRREWQATHTKTRMMEKVVGRAQQEEQREQDRREQRDTDERAQRGGGGPGTDDA